MPIEDRVAKMETDIAIHESTLKELMGKILEMRKEISAGFAHIDQRFDATDKRLDAIEQKLTQ